MLCPPTSWSADTNNWPNLIDLKVSALVSESSLMNLHNWIFAHSKVVWWWAEKQLNYTKDGLILKKKRKKKKGAVLNNDTESEFPWMKQSLFR